MSEIEIYRRSEQFIRNDDRRGFHSYHGDRGEYSDQTRSLVRSRPIGGSVRGLWPKSPAANHAQELRLILGDKAGLLLTMPLIIFVAEASDGTLVGFLEVDLRSHADGCKPITACGIYRGLVRYRGSRHCGVRRNPPITRSTFEKFLLSTLHPEVPQL
jgi:hypothetical protein